MKKISSKGIIFDLDGTIVDTVVDLQSALNYTLKKNGFPEMSLEQTRRFIGNGMKELLRKSVPEAYKKEESLLDKMRLELVSYYHENLLNNTKPYEGIPELLKWLREHDVKLAVSSNKTDNESKLIIKTLFPDVEFVEVLGNRPGFPHKPDPLQTDEIINKMGLNRDEILYIGDSITDYFTAKNSGLNMILVTYGYGNLKELESLCNIELQNSTEKLRARLEEIVD